MFEDLAVDVDDNLRRSYDEARTRWSAFQGAQTTAIPAVPDDDHSNRYGGIEWITGPFAKQGAARSPREQNEE